MTIERTFNDISKENITKADSHNFLVGLGYSNGIGWGDLLNSKRVLIISEAGAGKTFECRTQCKALWDAGEPSFFLDLSILASSNMRDMLDYQEEARLETWLSSQSDTATFFLDSIDELKLSLGSFAQALKMLNKGIRDQLARVRIIITTRPIPFDFQLIRTILPIPDLSMTDVGAESFAELAMNKNANRNTPEVGIPPEWRTVALMPLSDTQILSFAQSEKVDDATALLADIGRRNAQEFARRPQDLIELCADWREFKRIRTHREQVVTNISVKLKPREDRREPAELSEERAIQGATRLALAVILTRRSTIRHSADADNDGNDAALDPAIVLPDWPPNERKALLERPLFGFASYGRVRFHHRSITEYLASVHLRNLRKKGMPISALKRLLFAETKGKLIVRPSKRPLAGWLALSESRVFELLRDNEPSILLNEGDPQSLTLGQRNQALRSFVRRYSDGGWRGLSVPNIQIQRFASPQLAPEINCLWQSVIENDEMREILIRLIEAGKIKECADIAYEVTVNKNAPELERIYALDALMVLCDGRLSIIATSIVENNNLWSKELIENAILQLFPSHLSIPQLCQLMVDIKAKKRGVFNFSWQLSNQIKASKLNTTDLETLRDGLVDQFSSGLRWEKNWPHIESDGRRWCNVLAVTCLLGLRSVVSDNWLHASILALRLHVNDYGRNEEISELTTILANLDATSNERLFWVTDKLNQSIQDLKDDPTDRFYNILSINYNGMLTHSRDWKWINAFIADKKQSVEDRTMLVEAAIYLIQGQSDIPASLEHIKSLVQDLHNLVLEIERRLKPSILSESHILRIEKQAKYKELQTRREAEATESWGTFWQEILEQPEKVFSNESSENTAWDLWRVMRNGGCGSHFSGWNRRFIETYFGKDTADRLRQILMRIWREKRPTLPSERPQDAKNTYLMIWELGLTAIYAEAEDPNWFNKLSDEEAQLAARYALFELNGFPSWFDSLVRIHPKAFDLTLGNEISLELNSKISDQNNSIILHRISNVSQTVASLLVPRLSQWLENQDDIFTEEVIPSGLAYRLSHVLDVILKSGNQNAIENLLVVAKLRLADVNHFELDLIWLKTLVRLDVSIGIEYLENRISDIKPEQNSKAVIYFCSLFRNRHDAILLLESNFSPPILLKLLRLAYHHIRPEDDQVHEGSYTPNARDDAERVRNEIVTALFNAKGEDGWKSKLEMASDPLCAHFKDRIIAVAEENWALEIDATAFSEEQLISLNMTGESPASTSLDMFAIMVNRLDDLKDLLLSDASPRETWALIPSERLMRREIARVLIDKANGLYNVDQESVTADEKETDIRLRSTVSKHEAIIELKLADNRTYKDLRDTIKDQLVTKYMASENSRAGCLMITLSKERSWLVPVIKKKIEFPKLISILQKEAERIVEDLGGTHHLHVCGLDLRPRLPKEKV
jgi:hypothetical protein